MAIREIVTNLFGNKLPIELIHYIILQTPDDWIIEVAHEGEIKDNGKRAITTGYAGWAKSKQITAINNTVLKFSCKNTQSWFTIGIGKEDYSDIGMKKGAGDWMSQRGHLNFFYMYDGRCNNDFPNTLDKMKPSYDDSYYGKDFKHFINRFEMHVNNCVLTFYINGVKQNGEWAIPLKFIVFFGIYYTKASLYLDN